LDNDTEFIERAQNGDLSAFKELVIKHRNNVYYLAYDLTRNREDAEDVSQEVFVKAYNSLKNFRFDAKFGSWLYRITVNTCLSLKSRKSYSAMRSHENIEQLTGSDSDIGNSQSTNPEKETDSVIMQTHVEVALEKLSMREKTVFIMRNISGMAFEEIVDVLKIRPGTARNLNFKALRKLRKELQFLRE